MKDILILLTKYSDPLSNAYYYFYAGKTYTHVSIGLGEQPDVFYSFNYKGFAVESLERHHKRGVRLSRCYRFSVSDRTYKKVQEMIGKILANAEAYHYTKRGMFCCLLGIPVHLKQRYFCSQFVAEMLERSQAVKLPRRPELFLPHHFIPLIESQTSFCVTENVV